MDVDDEDEGWDDSVADGCITDIVITGEVSNVFPFKSFLDSITALGNCEFWTVFLPHWLL